MLIYNKLASEYRADIVTLPSFPLHILNVISNILPYVQYQKNRIDSSEPYWKWWCF